ncbi:alpha/beta hydrolase [Desulfosporosinus sp. FKB]|uniref:alpha/beta fold hydrolase n=1 Tax=Desulfosporosinus sp. FKB TaxID=1969835 RepID=UPI000B4A3F2E|nr:alpha/beta hydrolase [Desulfosporosinus sp. FKB]
MPTIQVNDINMYYEFHGEGEQLVLIAGLGTDLTVYEPTINRLSERLKVLAFDNRGVGRTDKPDIPYKIEIMADDTAELMNGVGINKAHIFGISMGGRIAMALALQHLDKVNSLILASTSATVKIGSSLRPGWLKLASRFGSIIKKNPQPKYAFERQLEASRGYDCSDQLNQIKVPTLILHGEKDKIAPFALAEEMHSEIKGSKITKFKGGHYFFMLENKKFTDSVIEFLDSID